MMDLPELNGRLTEAELLAIRASLPPKVPAGHPLQAYKWDLACRLRAARIRSRKAPTDATDSQVFAMVSAAPLLSPECSLPMRPWLSGRFPTIDHVIPIAKGGTNHIKNLRVICNRCNARKGGR